MVNTSSKNDTLEKKRPNWRLYGFLEAISKIKITSEGEAQDDEKMERTRLYARLLSHSAIPPLAGPFGR